MKQTFIYTAALTLLMLATVAACSNELPDSNRTPEKQPGEAGRLITVTATQGDRPQTRLGYDDPNDPTKPIEVTWATGDKFFIGKDWSAFTGDATSLSSATDYFFPFTLEGEGGSKSADFIGSLPADVPNGATLYGIYGDGEKRITIDKKETGALFFDYDNQVQTANGDTKHLSAVDFMVATITNETDKQPIFAFKHIGAMMKFTITLPNENMELSKLSLRASGSVFPFSSKMKWKTNESQTFESDYTTNEITLDLKQDNGNLQINGNVLTAYMMVAPTTELAGKSVILKIEDNGYKLYAAILNGAVIEAGRYYTVDAEVVKSPFNGEGTESSPYKINDGGELRNMEKLVNAGLLEDQCFKLTNDIDLGSEPWTPIDDFEGTFSGEKEDGGSYTISNMKINGTLSAVHLGLFANLSGGKISHVTVSGEIGATVNMMYFNSFAEIGGIVGRISRSSIVEHCTSQCTINVTAGNGIERICAGGIVGLIISKGTLTDCRNSGSISLNKGAATELYTGAIIGQIDEDDTVTLNGYANTGSPSSIIGFYEFTSGSTGSLTISEAVDGTTTTISSGSGPYPLPDKGISLGDRTNVTW